MAYSVDLEGSLVASASPQEDRPVPPRRNCAEPGCVGAAAGMSSWCVAHQPEVLPEPPSPNPSEFDPDAVETWRQMQDLERRRNRTGAVRVNVVGVDEEGRTPAGASHWAFRPPVFDPDEHHTEPMVLRNPNGEGNDETLMFRQPPPVHCKTASASLNAREARRQQVIASDAERERRLFAEAAREVGVDALGLSQRQITRHKSKRRRRGD